MKLTDIFTGRTKNEDVGRLQKAPVSSNTAAANRQIRSMVPGQTIQGEIVSRNGGEVQIRMADDILLNARVDQNMNIEVGKNMTFEVKNNGSALTLSPLFTNVSTDMNVLKALDMAGISVNPTSVAMTEQMMEAGLPIDRSSIQQLYREVNAFPDAEISDIVNLHKLGLAVNRENVEQMAVYRNLNHQLTQGMETVMDALPDVLEELTAKGDMTGAARLYQELLHMARESGLAENMSGDAALQGTAGNEAESGAAGVQGTLEEGILSQAGKGTADGELVETLGTAVKLSVDANGIELAENGGIQRDGGAQAQEIPQELRAAVSQELRQALSLLELPPQEREQLAWQIQQFAENGSGADQLFGTVEQMLESAGREAGGKEAMGLLMSGKGVRTLLADTLRNSWTLRPQDVAEPGKVEDLYKRLDRQLKGLTQTLETVGQGGSEAYKAASNMSQNIDFLQQINQMYTYVQLPLRLQQGNAHGDLYVYTNKKNLAAKDGSVSALLHLDMEHLGPVDVYVAMQHSRVSTHFYVADDEMLDFLEAHMDLLTDRLQKRGYDCSLSMEIRGEKEAKGGLGPILEQEKGVALSQYSFDVRT
ncbi:MAG: flagellar hook-length control protein FliK [Blautia sp.]|nr:flagellar hook-length control protein FliK [Blautia sp.]